MFYHTQIILHANVCTRMFVHTLLNLYVLYMFIYGVFTPDFVVVITFRTLGGCCSKLVSGSV